MHLETDLKKVSFKIRHFTITYACLVNIVIYWKKDILSDIYRIALKHVLSNYKYGKNVYMFTIT